MQWLIDLVIEAIGIPPVFIDRGDPEGFDFTQAVLTMDGTWHELDLSAIVPADASVILIGGFIRDGVVEKTVRFRKSGNANALNVSLMYTQVAGVFIGQDFTIAASPNQKIEYLADAAIDIIALVVRGWWL